MVTPYNKYNFISDNDIGSSINYSIEKIKDVIKNFVAMVQNTYDKNNDFNCIEAFENFNIENVVDKLCNFYQDFYFKNPCIKEFEEAEELRDEMENDVFCTIKSFYEGMVLDFLDENDIVFSDEEVEFLSY